MSLPSPKSNLRSYLQDARDALVWKLDGLSEYDMRRPMTATGTNLLGLIKHVATCEAGYFGETFGRPFPEDMPWAATAADLNSDMWVTEDEASNDIVDLYRRVWAHSDATIDSLDLDDEGLVPHWVANGRVTLHRVLVHMIAETHRHAGHADIVRELIDGAVGLRIDNDNMASSDARWWSEFRDRVQRSAETWR